MTAGATYVPIATTTLGSNTNTVTFSSIPSTYTDLVVIKTGSQNASDNLTININGDSGNNYSGTQVDGAAGTANSDRYSNQPHMYVNYSNSTSDLIIGIFNFMNYSNTTTYKTMIARNSDGSFYVGAYVHLWRSTSAINQLVFSTGGSGIYAGSTFTLYGISAA